MEAARNTSHVGDNKYRKGKIMYMTPLRNTIDNPVIIEIIHEY